MKPKSGEQDPEDVALFREALRDVKPLARAIRVAAAPPKPRARVARAERLQELEETAPGPGPAPTLDAADPTSFARPGVTAAGLRKLRRGQYSVDAELDLHGLTAHDAQRQLRAFLLTALQQHRQCLRIVHGKGLRSGERGPVLRQLVDRTLRRTAQVLAFTSARPVDGGTGAVYVLLAPQR